MFGDNWDVWEGLRERQAAIYKEHRIANGFDGKLNLHKVFPPGFYFFWFKK